MVGPFLREEAGVPGGGEVVPPVEGGVVCILHKVPASPQERAFL